MKLLLRRTERPYEIPLVRADQVFLRLSGDMVRYSSFSIVKYVLRPRNIMTPFVCAVGFHPLNGGGVGGVGAHSLNHVVCVCSKFQYFVHHDER